MDEKYIPDCALRSVTHGEPAIVHQSGQLGAKRQVKNSQPDHGQKYHEGRKGRTVTVIALRGEPSTELRDDETGFYSLEEQTCDAWAKHGGLTL